MTSRTEFENWCREHFGWDESRFDMHGGEYINGKTFEKWECWKQSRSVMCVRLPGTVSVESDGMIGGSTYYRQDQLITALDAAGVSYE